MIEQQDSPLDWDPLPPLRIHHFMLATITVAAMTSLYSALMQSRDSAPVAYYVFHVFGPAIPQTLAATTLALGVYWRLNGYGAFFKSPGHWLLIVATIDLAFGIFGPLYQALIAPFSRPAVGVMAWLPFAAFSLLAGLARILTFFAAPRFIDQQHGWRRFFLTIGSVQLLSYAFIISVFGLPRMMWLPSSIGTTSFLITMVEALIWAVLVLFIITGIRADIRLNVARHWSHWCGVATWLWITMLGAARQLFAFFSQW